MTRAALEHQLKLLRQGLPVAEDMMIYDKGVSFRRVEAKIEALETELRKGDWK